MRNPLPLDIITADDDQTYICCTAQTLHGYGLLVSDSRYTVFGYYPNNCTALGISWNEWPSGTDFARVVRAQCNQTYKHGDLYGLNVLLSIGELINDLYSDSTEFVYLQDDRIKPFKYSDPKAGDTLVTQNYELWTVCSLQTLQTTYGVNLKGIAQPGKVFGFQPVAHLCDTSISWNSWERGDTTQGDFTIAKIVPAYINQRLIAEGEQALIDGQTYTLLDRVKLLDALLSLCGTKLVSLSDNGTVTPYGDLKLTPT